ncbi:DarT1-associated NADAR antitoxin family protein [Parasulfitobacter algicola]|uniref:Uncharacterized protein n=1 Tax=Parasulfitobacter algicola TaxID=2614809 RepID=A0ABX2IW83_9RHOB|nr:hypothetical protein [Sulfitobacter algicola]NSX56291.1 hypothetical protein [Sulfitobacter algicola]
MAIRPIFVPLEGRKGHDGRFRSGPLVERVDIEIKWHGGFAVSQKQKNISAIHEKALGMGIHPVLEISTKSMQEVGRRLSAFNLKIEVDGDMKSLESVYQSCKVFSESGQHEFLMDLDSFKSKRSIRELGKGQIIAFRFLGKKYDTEPKNAFYDWLYLRAIAPHEEWIKENLNYKAYSDIEFTPDKSLNCQARAVAEFHALSMRGKAIECARDFDQFKSLLQMAQREDEL